MASLTRKGRTTSLRLSFTFEDEGLALLGDLTFDIGALAGTIALDSDGTDSGFSTPESFSPLPESLIFDTTDAAVHGLPDLTAGMGVVPGQIELLKPLDLAHPVSLSDLPPITGLENYHFPALGDICDELDVAADFIGLHVDNAADLLGDFHSALGVGSATHWDPSGLLLHSTTSLLLSPPPATFNVASPQLAGLGSPVMSADTHANASIRPTLVDNAQGSASEDEEDEIDVVTVEEESTTSAVAAASKKASPATTMVPTTTEQKPNKVSKKPSVSMPPAMPLASTSAATATAAEMLAVPLSSASAAAAPTQQVAPMDVDLQQPLSVAPAPTVVLPAVSSPTSGPVAPSDSAPLPPLSSMGLPPLMFPGGYNNKSGMTSPTGPTPAASRAPMAKYHPYASMAASNANAHTPKRNTERKRQLHNELERKRREDLNNVFNALGDVIPDLSGPGKNGQPTQTQILQGATDHLRFLKEEYAELVRHREQALREQAALRARLMELSATA